MLTFFIDSGQPGSGVEQNPHAVVGVPLTPGNKNLALHHDGERWSGPGLAIIVIRLFSLCLGAVSIALLYRLIRRALPGMPFVAIAGAAILALNPEFLFISASVNNDNLMAALAIWCLILLVEAGERGATAHTAVLIGASLGLALLTKFTALGLLPLAALAFAFGFWRTRIVRYVTLYPAIAFGLALLISGWWYLRNYLLYGDPTGLSVFLKIVNTRNPPPPLYELIFQELEGFRISFWALFGGVNLLAPPAIYQIYDVLVVAAILGLAFSGFKAFRARSVPGNPSLFVTALLLVWAAAVSYGLLRWSQSTLASQGRLLFPAMPGIALLFAYGLVGWASAPVQRRLTAGLTVALAGIALFLPIAVIAPAYAATPPISAADVAAAQPKLNIDFGDKIRLVSASVSDRSYGYNDRVPVTIVWQTLGPVDKNYSVFVQVFARDGRKIGQTDSYPGLGTRPFSEWKTGDAYRDTYSVFIDQQTEGPVLLRIEAGLYDFRTGQRLSAKSAGSEIGTSPLVAQVRLSDPPRDDSPVIATKAVFGDQIAVDGVSVYLAPRLPRNDTRPPGYGIAMYSRALKKMEKDWTVFVQLLDRDNRVLSQRDGPPISGGYPTSFWLAGERVIDRREIPAPLEVPAGARLVIGFYDPASGQRLPRTDSTGDMLTIDTLPTAGGAW